MFLVKWRVSGKVFVGEEVFQSPEAAQIKADKIQSAINIHFGFLPSNGAWVIRKD